MEKNEQITGEETQEKSDTSWWSMGTFGVVLIALLLFIASLPLPSDEEMQERYEKKISSPEYGYSQSGDTIYIFDGTRQTTIKELIGKEKEKNELKEEHEASMKFLMDENRRAWERIHACEGVSDK
jgi:hypothetical protein